MSANPAPVAVVTGATSGIGRFIALGLARAGYLLVLPVRERGRGEAVRNWIAARRDGAAVELVEADLSSLASTAAAAAQIRERHAAIGVLVNNAGVFRARRERTAEGYDTVLAVNHLSPHLLTRSLLPALRAGGAARIVTVGSSTSDRVRLDPSRLVLGWRWTMTSAYAQSKLAIMMSTFETARRLEGTGVVANVVHPGMVATNLIRSGGPIGLAWRAMAPWVRTEEEGADTPLHVAVAPELAGITGQYFKNRQAVPPNPRALDAGLTGRLFEATEALISATRPGSA